MLPTPTPTDALVQVGVQQIGGTKFPFFWVAHVTNVLCNQYCIRILSQLPPPLISLTHTQACTRTNTSHRIGSYIILILLNCETGFSGVIRETSEYICHCVAAQRRILHEQSPLALFMGWDTCFAFHLKELCHSSFHMSKKLFFKVCEKI